MAGGCECFFILSPPCGGGAPRHDRSRDGWGGVRINTILLAHRRAPPHHSLRSCITPPPQGGDKLIIYVWQYNITDPQYSSKIPRLQRYRLHCGQALPNLLAHK